MAKPRKRIGMEKTAHNESLDNIFDDSFEPWPAYDEDDDDENDDDDDE